MLTQETISRIKESILLSSDVEKIILFGSQARDQSDLRSDVDLLIISRNVNDRVKMMRELRRRLLGIEYAFDVIVISAEEFERDCKIPGTISRYASVEGKVLYE